MKCLLRTLIMSSKFTPGRNSHSCIEKHDKNNNCLAKIAKINNFWRWWPVITIGTHIYKLDIPFVKDLFCRCVSQKENVETSNKKCTFSFKKFNDTETLCVTWLIYIYIYTHRQGYPSYIFVTLIPFFQMRIVGHSTQTCNFCHGTWYPLVLALTLMDTATHN